jgi:hypothetical protein
MRRFSIAIIITVLLVGCTTSTGVIPAGPNSYVLTVRMSPIMGGAMAAQPVALERASDYCQGQGRDMMLVNSQVIAEREAVTPPQYSITFRCLLPTDPEFKR